MGAKITFLKLKKYKKILWIPPHRIKGGSRVTNDRLNEDKAVVQCLEITEIL